jgi:Mn2+/Fe2+ NRAMP family transporter
MGAFVNGTTAIWLGWISVAVIVVLNGVLLWQSLV